MVVIIYLLEALQVGLRYKGLTETNQAAKIFRPRYKNSWKQVFGSGDLTQPIHAPDHSWGQHDDSWQFGSRSAGLDRG